MKLRKLSAFVLSTSLILTALSAAADFDPIDRAQIYDADPSGFSIVHNSTAMFGKIYVATYDDNGRLINVSSAPVDIIGGETNRTEYSYSELGIEPEAIKTGTKLMLWSTYTNDMRPALNTFIVPRYIPEVHDYDSAENNPTMVVKKIIEKTDDDGNTFYIVVGNQNGSEVRYNITQNSIIAKMVGSYEDRIYNAEKVWDAYTEDIELTDVLKAGDIVGVDNDGHVFMIIVDAEELVRGVLSNEVPEMYNMVISWSALRDSHVTGPISNIDIHNNAAFITAVNYNMYVDPARSIDVIVASPDGTTALASEADTVYDLVPFDEETGKGDYVYARYANKGQLQEMYIYRFE